MAVDHVRRAQVPLLDHGVDRGRPRPGQAPQELADLEEQAAAPDLWDDQEQAQKVTSQLSHLQGEINRVESLRGRIDDLAVLFELAEDEDDADTRAEAETELAVAQKAIDELEVRTLLSGEYDAREALVTIRAEAGGVDAADFAEMLMRMYLRWAERHGYPTEVYDTSYAEEAGIKSATFAVKVPYAYGTLSVEQGTHRLVRISPVRQPGPPPDRPSPASRCCPVVEQTDHIEIPENELRVDVYRSSRPRRPGRQHHRLRGAPHAPPDRHRRLLPERALADPEQGRRACASSQAKLLERRRQEEQAKMDALKGDTSGSWGNQMRSYVLHPYQMVKDLRTELRDRQHRGRARRRDRRLHRGRHPLAQAAGDRGLTRAECRTPRDKVPRARQSAVQNVGVRGRPSRHHAMVSLRETAGWPRGSPARSPSTRPAPPSARLRRMSGSRG